MVEISLSGSGEGPGRATGRGYSTPGWLFREIAVLSQDNVTPMRFHDNLGTPARNWHNRWRGGCLAAPASETTYMELAALIAALSERAAYPFPVDKVDLRHTHISVVFLAGGFAYKVK